MAVIIRLREVQVTEPKIGVDGGIYQMVTFILREDTAARTTEGYHYLRLTLRHGMTLDILSNLLAALASEAASGPPKD